MDIKKLVGRYHAPILTEIINMHPEWEKGAEIGVAQGRTLKSIMDYTSVNMIAVDAFEYVPDSINSGLYKEMKHDENEQYVMAVAEAYPGRIEVLKGISWKMADLVPKNSLDFVFIDAGHHYNEVKKDILAWRPTVKPGGWVMGHDYSDKWPGVIEAVNEVLGKPVEMMQSIWVQRKD